MNLVKVADLMQLLLLALSSARSSVAPGRFEKKVIKFLKLRTRYSRNQERRRAADGLSLILAPEKSPEQREEIVMSRYQSGLVNMEIVWLRAMVRFGSERKVACRQVVIEGREHLNEALGRGKGVVLIKSPFGKRLMGTLVLAEEGYPVSQVHDRRHGGSSSWLGQKLIRRLHRKWESQLFSDILEIDNLSLAYLRPIIQRLRQNRVVCMPGMAGGANRYLPVEFLGVPAKKMFPTGVASLARTTGAALIPFFCYRDSAGSDRLKVEAPIDVRQAGSTDEDLQLALRKYSRLVESYVLKYPSQFMRWHEIPRHYSGRMKALDQRYFLTVDAESAVIAEGVQAISSLRSEVERELDTKIPIVWLVRFQRSWGEYVSNQPPEYFRSPPRKVFDGFELARTQLSDMMRRGDEIGWHYHAYHYVHHPELSHHERISSLLFDLEACHNELRERHPCFDIRSFRFGWFFIPDYRVFGKLKALGIDSDASVRPERYGKKVARFATSFLAPITEHPRELGGMTFFPFRRTLSLHDWTLVPHQFSWRTLSERQARENRKGFKRKLMKRTVRLQETGGCFSTYREFPRDHLLQ